MDLDPEDALPKSGMVLAHIEDLAQQRTMSLEFRVDERLGRLILVYHDGEVTCFINKCPHARAPLDWIGGRCLDPTGRYLQCAVHGALFRMSDGYCIKGPCYGDNLESFPVIVEDSVVLAARGDGSDRTYKPLDE